MGVTVKTWHKKERISQVLPTVTNDFLFHFLLLDPPTIKSKGKMVGLKFKKEMFIPVNPWKRSSFRNEG